ncbi:MAG: glycoside hydrolase family 3 C-terminal domain-containing protein [bacterium]|nr:glycoside hydrolase family 3 C-terminal domain-containing protein [bacterium]
MSRKIIPTTLTGTTTEQPREYEELGRQISRKAAADGIVLLKNEDEILPLEKGMNLALFGGGAIYTIKGGTGSGDVNARETISIYEGLKNAGYTITSEDWIDAYREEYHRARNEWRELVWKDEAALRSQNHPDPMFAAFSNRQFDMPAGAVPTEVTGDAAIMCISRVAGEAKDRENRENDYQLSIGEKQVLKAICEKHDRVIVLINSGGLIDLSFVDEYPQIKGLLFVGQPGMEGGNAIADVLSGAVTPSGKLTDSWPYRYEDYPNASTFSHMNGDTGTERYTEGIYVGYRYFDTFEVPVRYSFGYGLSYTKFAICVRELRFINPGKKNAGVRLTMEVKNTGKSYSGREVVQVYVSCPQKNIEKEYRRLVGFAKTKELAPGESCEVMIEAEFRQMASYSERAAGWLMDCGTYGLFIGNSLQASKLMASFELTKNILLTKHEAICPLQEELKELDCPKESVLARRAKWHALCSKNPAIVIPTQKLRSRHTYHYGKSDKKIAPQVWETVETLSDDQLLKLISGDPSKAPNALGVAGNAVPGSAAQTSTCALEQGIASIVLADGPAGVRLTKTYYQKDGNIQLMPVEASMYDGFFYKGDVKVEGEKRYQFCTAFPVGVQLAQTWDTDLMEAVGAAVAREMKEFHITLWLAPGMNIHRNPLCGRNFEYYSEDPLLSGSLAAAITRGVQQAGGVGTTLKHLACNNQEDNRFHSNSVISERALREIYLRGFEIAVKEAKPLAIMTSYNLINGVHAANNYDLCTKVVRDEWGFEGVIMTDWTTTNQGDDCTAAGCMRAGNDLVMPGTDEDQVNLKQELADGTLSMDDVKRSVAHLLPIIWQSDCYEKE